MRLHVRIFCLLLVANVTLRLFTNHLGLLPRQLNLTDSVLTLLLWAMSLFHTPPYPRHPLHRALGVALPVINGILLLGWLLNPYPGYLPAAISQALMLNEPLLLLLAMSRMGLTESDVGRYLKLLGFLIKLELFIGILQIPLYIQTGDSESIMGTFHHNAEQYGAFLTLGMFYSIGKLRVEERGNRWRRLMIVGMLGLVLCIDNKASWVGLAVSILVLLVCLGALDGRWASLMAALVGGTVLLGIAVLVATQVSGTISKIARLAEVWRNGEVAQLGKIKALRDIWISHSEHPHMWLVGSGPGSFYSRSARQFFGRSADNLFTETTFRRSDDGDFRASDSMGGVIERGGMVPYFATIQQPGEGIVPVGSGQVDEPFSFYNGLLSELGLAGLVLYLSVYWMLHRVIRRVLQSHPLDRRVVPLAAATYGFLIYLAVNSLYGPLLETGRMTTILWSLAACCLVYDQNGQHGVGAEDALN